jgi:acyl carrier protein
VRPTLLFIDCRGRIGWVGRAHHPRDQVRPARNPVAIELVAEEGRETMSGSPSRDEIESVEAPPRRTRSSTSPPADLELRAQAMSAIARLLGVSVSRATEDSELVDDLGAGSLQLVELAIAFEELFDIEIGDDELGKIRTVGDAMACVERAFRRRHGRRGY